MSSGSGTDVSVGGYAVVPELAVSNLLLGTTVVVDAVTPVAEARTPWREAAARAGAAGERRDGAARSGGAPSPRRGA